MPSWNIHSAHVEALLKKRSPQELGIRNVNAFLFGNFLPDVYVGYMVKPTTRIIVYNDTHFADPNFVPEPRYWEFWRRFGLPSADADGRVSDLVLGTWCHLVADNAYNHDVNAFIEGMGIRPGETTRIRKQGDFDLFGRTLDLRLECHLDDELVRQAHAFPQYPVLEPDLRASVAAASAIVRDNRLHHVDGTPAYSMLTPELFSNMFEEVQQRMLEGLLAYAEQGASAEPLRREGPRARRR